MLIETCKVFAQHGPTAAELLSKAPAASITKTTHPQFIALMQELLDGLGVGVALELPYRFKTKGQMLQECRNQPLLEELASGTTSCGRFRTYNRTHCGRCVPCMIRKGRSTHGGRTATERSTSTTPLLKQTSRAAPTTRWRQRSRCSP
jgi:hypothetical protein